MSTDARTPGGGRSGLAARLLLAFTLVMGVAGVTAWLVAGFAGPVLFHRHLVTFQGDGLGKCFGTYLE